MTSIQPTELWRWQDGTAGVDNLYGAAVVGNESALVLTGRTAGDWETANAGNFDFMAAKFTADGAEQWRFQAGTVKEDVFHDVTATGKERSDGSIVLVGSTRGVWNGTESAGDQDFVAAKISSEGSLLWIWQDGTSGNDTMVGVAACSDDEVVLVGRTDGDWEGANAGGTDVAVSKLSVDSGATIWRYQVGSSEEDIAKSVAAAGSDGSVVIAGYTEGDLGWPNAGGSDFFAMKLDAAGNEAWTWQGGTADDDFISSVAVGTNGSVLLAGYTMGRWGFNNTGEADFAAVMLNEDGVEVWRWQEGTSLRDKIFAAVATEDGSFVLAGYTEGDWGSSGAGGSDFAVVKLTSNGTVSWRWQDGTSESDWVTTAALDAASGSVIFAGSSKGGWRSGDGVPAGLEDFAAVVLNVGVGTSTTPTPAPHLSYGFGSASGSWSGTAVGSENLTPAPSRSYGWGSASASQSASIAEVGTSSPTPVTIFHYNASGSAQASLTSTMLTPAPSSSHQEIVAEPLSSSVSGDDSESSTSAAPHSISVDDSSAPSMAPHAPSPAPNGITLGPTSPELPVGAEPESTQAPRAEEGSTHVASPAAASTTSGATLEIQSPPSMGETLLLTMTATLLPRLFLSRKWRW